MMLCDVQLSVSLSLCLAWQACFSFHCQSASTFSRISLRDICFPFPITCLDFSSPHFSSSYLDLSNFCIPVSAASHFLLIPFPTLIPKQGSPIGCTHLFSSAPRPSQPANWMSWGCASTFDPTAGWSSDTKCTLPPHLLGGSGVLQARGGG